MATTCRTRNRRRPNGFFVPAFENIVNEMMNSSLKDVVTHNNINYTNPSANIIKSETGYTLELALPGLSKKDVDIKVDKESLIISSKLENEDEKSYRLREFKYGTFERRFRLSDTIDKDDIKATFKNGVLTVTLKKIEKPEPKKITIK